MIAERRWAAVVGPEADVYGHELYAAAVRVGARLGADRFRSVDVEEHLVSAAVGAGWRERAARSHVRRGIRWGERHARSVAERPSAIFGRRFAPGLEASTEPRGFPPRGEVNSLWDSCVSICADAEVSVWLASRGLDVGAVDLEAEIRALPRGRSVPPWARFGGRAWTASGHRAILPVRDSTGALVSVRARAVVPVADGDLKTLVPTGFCVGGAVLADHLGRHLLSGERLELWNGVVVVVEGEPDFLSIASNRSDAVESTYAVFGVASGSWTPALGARIPVGSTVVLRTDLDVAGDKYAADVARTLAPGIAVLRTARGARP